MPNYTPGAAYEQKRAAEQEAKMKAALRKYDGCEEGALGEVRDRSEIEIRMEALEKVGHSLGEAVSRLAERLSPVVRGVPGPGEVAEACPPSVSCPLSGNLFELEMLFSRSDRQLRELLDGLRL